MISPTVPNVYVDPKILHPILWSRPSTQVPQALQGVLIQVKPGNCCLRKQRVEGKRLTHSTTERESGKQLSSC
jgi:hypothetical protein